MTTPNKTPETDQLLECDQHKVDDDGTEYSAYVRMTEHARQMERERDEAIALREWDNRAISIARHYGHQDPNRGQFEEDTRVRPALVLEKAVPVALDAWGDGNAVTISLCPVECEQWVALVTVAGHEVTGFSMDQSCDVEREPEELWMPPAVLAALDHARSAPVPPEQPPVDERIAAMFAPKAEIGKEDRP